MRNPRTLVISPFDAAGRRTFDAVSRALSDVGIDVWDIDIPPGAGWANEITRAMRSSDFVVVDISRQNPNVLYELGFAHALRKPTIIIASSEGTRSIPSDLSGFPYIVYDPNNLGSLVESVQRAAKNLVSEANQIG